MKKYLILTVLCLMTAVSIQAQAIKIGYINSLELLSLMPETKEADAKLQKLAKELETQYREYVLEYQKQLNILQTDTSLSEIAKEAKIQDLTTLEQRITDFETSSQDKISKKRSELYEPLLAKATEIVQGVATENGYTHILDSSTGVVIFAPEGDDILGLVKAKLGQ